MNHQPLQLFSVCVNGTVEIKLCEKCVWVCYCVWVCVADGGLIDVLDLSATRFSEPGRYPRPGWLRKVKEWKRQRARRSDGTRVPVLVFQCSFGADLEHIMAPGTLSLGTWEWGATSPHYMVTRGEDHLYNSPQRTNSQVGEQMGWENSMKQYAFMVLLVATGATTI